MPALRNLPKSRGQDRDLVYLLQLERKHNLAPRNLHDSLMAASQHDKARCEELSIEIRGRGPDSSTYMFSVKGKPLAQANIQNDSIKKLKRLPEEYSSLLEMDERRSYVRKLDARSESAI